MLGSGASDPFAAVELVDERFVETEIVYDGETVVGRQIDGVSVWAFLPLWICAVTGVLHKGRSLTQASIVEHRKYCDAAAGVVCHQNILSGFVHGDVAGICAVGGDFIQKCQFARRAIDGEGADCSTLLTFVVRSTSFTAYRKRWLG